MRLEYLPIVIVGESGSGKSTLAESLTRMCPQLERVVTYTTRPKRDGEQEGIDYHFLEADEFKSLALSGFFLENSSYRGWDYGVSRACVHNNGILVLTPAGMRKVKRECDVVTIYLKVDRKSRLIKLLKRGDDIEEAYRRSLSDVGQFDGIESEVDYIINNKEYMLRTDEIAKVVMDIMKGKKVGHD